MINEFEWTTEVQPMKPEVLWLNDNFGDLEKVIKDVKTYYVDSDRKPLFYFYQNSENKYCYINSYRIWSVLESKFGLNYEEIQGVVGEWLESTHNLRGFTPNNLYIKSVWV